MEYTEIGNLRIRGTEIYYLIVCARKLWLFQKGIQMEHTSDRVKEGTVLHETSYKRQQNKEVAIDNLIQIDILDGETVREVKSSSKMYNADKMQILYYLYYLKHEYDIEKSGTLHYPKEKKQKQLYLLKKQNTKLSF